MRLVRFGEKGEERPGIWLDSKPNQDTAPCILDIQNSAFDIHDFDPLFFEGPGGTRLEYLLAENNTRYIPANEVRLGPPVASPGKIVCVGKNYAAHAAEMNTAPPEYPIFFAKPISALTGPYDPIVLPAGCGRVDSEVELAIVIGKQARDIEEAHAWDHVAGYTILNDVTDRDLQLRHDQWFLGKGGDTFCPIGPYIVTRDEIPEPDKLVLRAKLNDKVLQEDHTSGMLFPIPRLLSVLSKTMTLSPGDIIATGTPPGIGSAHTPPAIMQDGDIVYLEIEGLGYQRNNVVAG